MELNSLAISIIAFLGNQAPNKKQVRVVESLLLNSGLKTELFFDKRLTKREVECLILSTLGHSSYETAEVLRISKKTVEQYRSDIKKKLSCKNMIQAAMQGIKYGYIKPMMIAE